MTTGHLELEFPGYIGAGTLSAVANEPGEPPTRIFDVNDLVEVTVDWSIPPYINSIVCGTWDCDLYMESMGKGKEFEIESTPVPINQANNLYHQVIKIPAGTIVPDTGETDVPYKMVVSVTFKNTLGRPGPMAGFVELPMVQFYKDA